ncbi:MAG: choice-of-anchor D domain-containing protein, partial [Acidobacteriota bacterium]
NFGFKPTATGARQGLLTAVVNPGPKQANYNFLLTGTGAADGPLLTFDVPTTPWEAGSQDLIYLYVANSGTTAVNLTNGLSISGTNAGDYSLYRGCGALAVGASCQVGLYVTPAQTGLRTATVTLTDSVSGLSFSTPITVLGTYSSALKPTLSPSPVQLPLTAVNDISAPVAVTVTRPLGDAVVGSFTPTTPDPGFVLTKSQCSADENPCVLEIVFKPTAAGSLGEYMSATDVETGLTGPVYVYGLAGVGPIASVPTSPISFSSRPAGTQSIATSVTLSNTGDAQFYPTISLGGTNPSDFLLTNGCGLVLNAGASCSISVAFAPGTSGGKMATLNISGDSGVGIPVANLPVAVSLSGTAF